MFDIRFLNVGPIGPVPELRLPISNAERHAHALAARIMPEILKGDLTPEMVVGSLVLAYNYGHADGKREAQRERIQN